MLPKQTKDKMKYYFPVFTFVTWIVKSPVLEPNISFLSFLKLSKLLSIDPLIIFGTVSRSISVI